MSLLTQTIDFEVKKLPKGYDAGDLGNAIGIALYKYRTLFFDDVNIDDYIREVEFGFNHGLHLEYDHP
jgi:hypothetical protein